MSETTVVVEFDANKITVFNEFEGKLAKLEEDNLAAVFDLTDKKGNAAARSHVYKIRLTKNPIEELAIKTKAKAVEYGKAVDVKKNEILARVEAMIDIHAIPIKKEEERQTARMEQHEINVGALTTWRHRAVMVLDDYVQALEEIEATVVDSSWEEFEGIGIATQSASITGLKDIIMKQQKAKIEQKELAELRKEKADREEKDRKVQARKDEAKRKQEETTRKKREAAEQTERDKQAEIKRVAREKEIRKEAAEEARKEAVAREEKLKDEAKQAKLDKIAADKKAKIDIENARLAEVKRQKDKETQEKDEIEKREADKRHVIAVMKKAEDAVVEATGLNRTKAKAVINSIYNKDIPDVTISF